jgi:hypothetical protein
MTGALAADKGKEGKEDKKHEWAITKLFDGVEDWFEEREKFFDSGADKGGDIEAIKKIFEGTANTTGTLLGLAVASPLALASIIPTTAAALIRHEEAVKAVIAGTLTGGFTGGLLSYAAAGGLFGITGLAIPAMPISIAIGGGIGAVYMMGRKAGFIFDETRKNIVYPSTLGVLTGSLAMATEVMVTNMLVAQGLAAVTFPPAVPIALGASAAVLWANRYQRNQTRHEPLPPL